MAKKEIETIESILVSIANNQHSHLKWFHCLINDYGHEMTINGNIEHWTHHLSQTHSQFTQKFDDYFISFAHFEFNLCTQVEDYSTHRHTRPPTPDSMATNAVSVYAYVTGDNCRTVKREIIKIWSRQMVWASDWIFAWNRIRCSKKRERMTKMNWCCCCNTNRIENDVNLVFFAEKR